VDPEAQNDWLDEALKERRPAAPPSDFTETVMQRVASVRPSSALASLLAEEGLHFGLSLAAFGVCLIVDVERLALMLERALGSPGAVPVVAVAAYVAWFLTKKEPEVEA